MKRSAEEWPGKQKMSRWRRRGFWIGSRRGVDLRTALSTRRKASWVPCHSQSLVLAVSDSRHCRAFSTPRRDPCLALCLLAGRMSAKLTFSSVLWTGIKEEPQALRVISEVGQSHSHASNVFPVVCHSALFDRLEREGAIGRTQKFQYRLGGIDHTRQTRH